MEALGPVARRQLKMSRIARGYNALSDAYDDHAFDPYALMFLLAYRQVRGIMKTSYDQCWTEMVS